MKVFRELSIRGEPSSLDAAAEEICQSLSDGWSRETDAESRIRADSLGDHRRIYCFACTTDGRRQAALVFLFGGEPDLLTVGNIVPRDKHMLTYEEYNFIAEEFFRRFVEPAARKHGVTAELTEPQVGLDHWLPPHAVEKLRLFSSFANKSTGSAHPMDRERWYDFIMAVHEADSDFDASTLARWLTEEAGWSAERSEELAIEYEFARGLLAHGERVGS